MSQNNQPPFYVGQRVIAVIDHSVGVFKKGDIFPITEVTRKHCNCDGWLVRIGNIFGDGNGSFCPTCIYKLSYGGVLWFCSSRFAPIEPAKAEIDESIIEQAKEMIGVEETKAPILEPVNN